LENEHFHWLLQLPGTLLHLIGIIYRTLVFKTKTTKNLSFNKSVLVRQTNSNVPLVISGVNGKIEMTLFVFVLVIATFYYVLYCHLVSSAVYVDSILFSI